MKATVKESRARAGDADVEPIITAWAQAGIFDDAAKNAIAVSHKKGNAVTIVENGIVYRFMPDGSKKELRKLVARPSGKWRRGTFRIKQ